MIVEAYLQDEQATLKLAGRLSSEIKGRGVIYLDGQLGTGKTTFSRGILRAMGYEGSVKSPTFTIVEPYDLEKGQVFHFDLYRLSDPEELEYLGIDDYLDGDQLCLIEWSERGLDFLPASDLVIRLAVEGKGRKIQIEGKSGYGKKICQILNTQ
jgi:tRNA threonylcarbamoyladenosine biosynthesis protein TsaE